VLSLYWAIAGVILIISEFFIPGFVIFFFGAGALLNALLTAVIQALRPNILVQVLIWLGFSGLSLFTLRKYFSKIFKGTLFDSRSSSDQAGEKAVVVEEVNPKKPGRIRYQGTTWRAVSFTETLKVGETVEILKKENLTYMVTHSLLDDKLPDDKLPDDMDGTDL
jgi:membrane protein implicated in regulation of membrane protease activity